MSPPRVDLSWEENTYVQFSDGSSPPGSPLSQISSIPSCAFSSSESTPQRAPYSPISEQEENPETNDNNYQSQEYVEPSIHPDLLEKISKFDKHNQNDETESVTSANSYAQLDTIWDGETIVLSDDDEFDVEPREAPPRKRFKNHHSPVMFCNLVCSNFIYHQSTHPSPVVHGPLVHATQGYHTMPIVHATTEYHAAQSVHTYAVIDDYSKAAFDAATADGARSVSGYYSVALPDVTHEGIKHK